MGQGDHATGDAMMAGERSKNIKPVARWAGCFVVLGVLGSVSATASTSSANGTLPSGVGISCVCG